MPELMGHACLPIYQAMTTYPIRLHQVCRIADETSGTEESIDNAYREATASSRALPWSSSFLDELDSKWTGQWGAALVRGRPDSLCR